MLRGVDAFLTVYMVWTGVIGVILVLMAWAIDAGTGIAVPVFLLSIAAGVTVFPVAIPLGLTAVLAWHALFVPNRTLDLDPRRRSSIFRVADMIGYLVVVLVALAILRGW